MTNIWASNFEEIRKPHFDIEDPYTKLQEEEKAGEKYEDKYKKTGKKSKDYDGDGEVEDEADEYAGVKDKAIKKGIAKEETLYTSKSAQKIVDVKKGIKNKITVGPEVKEEVEEWVDQLVNEGYDLSEFTWDEITNIYLDEAGGSSSMPPAGDAETKRVDPMAAAKARAAKAKVTKEIADLQVAKQAQRTKVSTTESVIQYLAQRSDPFENLEEGVFDPNKTKMRPASQRSKTQMTDAQRKAAKKEQERVTAIHSQGETVLTGLTSSGRRGRVDTAPKPKPAAPEANRKVKGKYDTLAKKASSILKSVQN